MEKEDPIWIKLSNLSLNLAESDLVSPSFDPRKIPCRAPTTFKRFLPSPEVLRKWNLREYHHLSISHCCMLPLFPLRYEFSRHELVTLWVADGLFPNSNNNNPEGAANKIFDSLVSRDIIVPSSSDQSVDFFHHKKRKLLYRVNRSRISSFKYSSSALGFMRILNGNNIYNVRSTVQHLSIDSKTLSLLGFEPFKRFQRLRTLFLIPSPGFYVERVPRDLFLSLKHLRSLNLSQSLLSELPSSIGNLKSLRYIDLSCTPIRRLPDSITGLHNLQTLRLRGCLEFVGLPREFGKLINLRHLDLDVMGQLKCMPHGMGDLTNLQTLSAFLVGVDEGYGVSELKDMVNLTGAFCISRIENVSSSEEAQEADLSNKKFLNMLQLRWTETREEDATKEEQILQCLRPPLCLEELSIVCYGGFNLPSWVAEPSYVNLVDITLYKCINCESLPPIGKLSSLQYLHIKEMHELRRIDELFCRDEEDQQSNAFPSLKELTMEVMPALEEWTGVQNGDFPCLNKIKLEHCPKLVSLPLLSCLNSLMHLEMSYCPNISSLPDGEVIASLKYLIIKDCTGLSENCNRMNGKDWDKIAHVPNIFIDDEEVSC